MIQDICVIVMVVIMAYLAARVRKSCKDTSKTQKDIDAYINKVKTSTFLVVKEWYDTGNKTYEVLTAESGADAIKGAEQGNEEGANTKYAIVNVVEL